jgi:large subunit ribosomal protein L18
MADNDTRNAKRQQRHRRVRRNISGTATRPRMAVFKSAKHMYVQVIDDGTGHTLAAVSTLSKGLREQLKGMKPAEAAVKLGSAIAEKAKEKGVTAVVYDRGGFPYQGRVKALAEAARAGGLQF